MKALEKDRTRRYETANGLARDIQRYLADEVVEARPPSRRLPAEEVRPKAQGAGDRREPGAVCALGRNGRHHLGARSIARQETAEKEKARHAEADRVTERDDALGKRDLALGEAKQANDDFKKANDQLSHRLGVSEMVLANAAYDNRDVKLAAERLDKVPAEQRGWEWHYLKRQVQRRHFHPLLDTRARSRAWRSARTARGSSPGAVINVNRSQAKVWDARTGMHLFDLKGLPTEVHGLNIPVVCVAFSADSKRIVTAGGDNTARVSDATTGSAPTRTERPTRGR